MLNPVHVKTFLEVIRTGSFAGAARTLGYTPSAVSQQISGLEHALGVELFERKGPRALPSVASRLLAERAPELLGMIATIERELHAVARGWSGEIRLGCFPSAAARFLPSALLELRRAHPGAQMFMTEGEPDELIPRLVAGELDLVVAYSYKLAPREWPDRTEVETLMNEDFLILISAHHKLAGRKRVGLAALRHATWISIRSETAGDRAVLRLCAAAGFEPRISYRCNDYGVIRELVRAGLGVAIVPTLGFESSHGIRSIACQGGSNQREVVLMHRVDSRNPLLTRMILSLRESARRCMESSCE